MDNVKALIVNLGGGSFFYVCIVYDGVISGYIYKNPNSGEIKVLPDNNDSGPGLLFNSKDNAYQALREYAYQGNYILEAEDANEYVLVPHPFGLEELLSKPAIDEVLSG